MITLKIHPFCLGVISGHRLLVLPRGFFEKIYLSIKGYRPCVKSEYPRCAQGGWWANKKHAKSKSSTWRKPSKSGVNK